MKKNVSIQIPRLHAEAIADLISQIPRIEIPLHIDYDVLCEFFDAVDYATRLEKAIYNSGLRQFGMMTVQSKEVKTFDINPEVALTLACFMEFINQRKV